MFKFNPVMIIVTEREEIKNNSRTGTWALFTEGATVGVPKGNDPYGTIYLSWSKNKVIFYNARSMYEQLNDNRIIYNYIGFGMVGPSVVILATPTFDETISWNFSISDNISIPADGAADVVVTMTRAGSNPNWSQGRYVTYSVIGADGSGRTEQALVRPYIGNPAPTFTIRVSNPQQQVVLVKITNVST